MNRPLVMGMPLLGRKPVSSAALKQLQPFMASLVEYRGRSMPELRAIAALRVNVKPALALRRGKP